MMTNPANPFSLSGKRVARLSLFVFLFMQVLSVPMAQAGMVTTDQLLADQAREQHIDTLSAQLNRDVVASRLQKYGVSIEDVQSRLDRLTDQEIAVLAEKAEQMPAAGDVLGLVVLVFLVLLILDLAEVTDVFPGVPAER